MKEPLEELQQWVDDHAFEIHECYKIKNFERLIQDRKEYIINDVRIKYEYDLIHIHEWTSISLFGHEILFRRNTNFNSKLYYFKFL